MSATWSKANPKPLHQRKRSRSRAAREFMLAEVSIQQMIGPRLRLLSPLTSCWSNRRCSYASSNNPEVRGSVSRTASSGAIRSAPAPTCSRRSGSPHLPRRWKRRATAGWRISRNLPRASVSSANPSSVRICPRGSRHRQRRGCFAPRAESPSRPELPIGEEGCVGTPEGSARHVVELRIVRRGLGVAKSESATLDPPLDENAAQPPLPSSRRTRPASPPSSTRRESGGRRKPP